MDVPSSGAFSSLGVVPTWEGLAFYSTWGFHPFAQTLALSLPRVHYSHQSAMVAHFVPPLALMWGCGPDCFVVSGIGLSSGNGVEGSTGTLIGSVGSGNSVVVFLGISLLNMVTFTLHE